MGSRVVGRAVACAAVGLAATSAAAAPAVAALSTPTAMSATCKSLQAKAIRAEAADPSGGGATPAQRAYLRRCPSADAIDIVSLGSLSTWQFVPDVKGRPVGIADVTTSNPKVIALGTPRRQSIDGQTTAVTVMQAVGVGRSRVCFTTVSDATRCILVVAPPAVTGKAGGRTLNVAFGHGPDDAAKVVSITTSDPAVVTVATDPMTTLPYVVLRAPGTATVCATFTKGRGGCQEWTFGS